MFKKIRDELKQYNNNGVMACRRRYSLAVQTIKISLNERRK